MTALGEALAFVPDWSDTDSWGTLAAHEAIATDREVVTILETEAEAGGPCVRLILAFDGRAWWVAGWEGAGMPWPTGFFGAEA